jgi:hypothetical protein
VRSGPLSGGGQPSGSTGLAVGSVLPVRISCLSLGVAATGLILALAGCSSGGQPLADGTAQEGMKVCVPAPNPGVTQAWNSPVAFTANYYYNPSSAPVEIESVSLIEPHNLVLRAIAVYEMRHAEHPLGEGFPWSQVGQTGDPVAWAHRQGVPGAVIPPEPSADGPPKPSGTRDEYQIVVGVAAATSAGGWAIGHQVTYRQGNRQYTIRTYTGYGIAPPGKATQPRCDAEMAAITGAWPAP